MVVKNKYLDRKSNIMNRRTFLQSIGATAIITTIPIFAKKEKLQNKWISFEDQMPEPIDKFEMRKINNPYTQICEGTAIQCDNHHGKRTFIAKRLSSNCLLVIKQDKWEWRYNA